MSLKDILPRRPVIYEIVPPRRDTSRYHSELTGVEDVLHEGRIDAVNIPELMKRHEGRQVHYSPVTIPPEEYALMIKDYKEAVVNVIAPRLPKDEFLHRTRTILHDYGVQNLVLVGKEKRDDILPGPGVLEGLRMLAPEKGTHASVGGICIFNRESKYAGEYGHVSGRLDEAKRVWSKAQAGCDFVTSQITFDAGQAVRFLEEYARLCEATGRDPITVFISLATIPTGSILSLIESLDVVVPAAVKKALGDGARMGKASVEISARVFEEITAEVERRHIDVPLGLQVEQVGVRSGELALELLDRTYPSFR